MDMELLYRPKKPDTIKRFMLENNIPVKLVIEEAGKPQIYVNNELKTRDDTIRKGDSLRIAIQDEKYDQTIKPEPMPLDIKFEDEYFLIINKPANMQVMVSKAHPTGTLANGLNHYFMEHNIKSQIHFINRLDKETSGLMLVAKNRFLKFLFSTKTENSVEREYYAILDGILDNKRLCIELPISRTEGTIIREVSLQGEECQTTYQVEREFSRYSLVKITQESGKTHQIRVHFAYFNYPIVGDDLYNKNHYNIDRMLLMSHRVAFQHPIKDQAVEVALPLDEAFTAFIRKFGG